MTRIVIIHNETELTREAYHFDYNPGHFGSVGTRLTRYAIETRATKRHKWTGPAWNSDYERKPHGSQLDRPVTLPVEVIDKLRIAIIDEALSMPVYIGWFNGASIIKDDLL